MLQRWQIALVQVKSGNASKKLLNGIRQFIYYLYQAKQITKKYTTIKWIQKSHKAEWILYLWILERVKIWSDYYSILQIKQALG